MRRGLYRLIVYLAVHRGRAVMLVALALTVLSLLAARSIRVQTNITKTLGEDAEVIETVERLQSRRRLVLLQHPADADVRHALRAERREG